MSNIEDMFWISGCVVHNFAKTVIIKFLFKFHISSINSLLSVLLVKIF